MAEDPTNPLASFINSLEQKKSNDGVIKDSDGKVSPALTPAETSRYKNIFKIMKDVIDPNPEAANVKSTKAAKIGSTEQIKAAADGGGGPGIGALAGPILALVGAAGLLAAYLKDLKKQFEDIFGKGNVEAATGIVRGLVSLQGIFKILSILGKILQPITKGFQLLKNSKAFQAVGKVFGQLGKVFPTLTKGFKALKNSKAFQAVGKAASSVLKVGSKIGKAAGGLFKIIGKVTKTIGKKLKFIPFLGSIFNFITAYEAFQNGNYIRAGLELLAGVLNLIPGVGNVAGSALNGVLLLYDIMSSSEEGEGLRDVLGNPGDKLKELVAPIVDKIVGLFKGIGSWIVEAGGKMINMVKDKLKDLLPFLFDDGPTEAEIQLDRSQTVARKADRKKYIDRAKARLGKNWRNADTFLPGEGSLDYVDRQIRIEKEREGIDLNDGVVRFDNQDAILGAKKGGPIDKMLDQNSAIQSQQLNVLREIRDGIRALQSSDGMSFNNSSLTQEFYA